MRCWASVIQLFFSGNVLYGLKESEVELFQEVDINPRNINNTGQVIATGSTAEVVKGELGGTIPIHKHLQLTPQDQSKRFLIGAI
jgi:hypothetical protein